MFRQAIVAVAVAVAVLAAFPSCVGPAARPAPQDDEPHVGPAAAPGAQDAQSERLYGEWVYTHIRTDDLGEMQRIDTAGNEVLFSVLCNLGVRDSFTLRLGMHMKDGIFHDGEVDFRWMGGPNDGEIESYTLNDLNEVLIGNEGNAQEARIFDRLESHSELRLRFRRWRDERVTDRISLSGFRRAFQALSLCR